MYSKIMYSNNIKYGRKISGSQLQNSVSCLTSHMSFAYNLDARIASTLVLKNFYLYM